MLVSEAHVLEERNITEQQLAEERGDIELYFEQTIDAIRDGVDFVAVSEQGDDTYKVDYRGYVFGRLVVNREGVAELGRNLFESDTEMGYWAVDAETVDDELPWWIPENAPVEQR